MTRCLALATLIVVMLTVITPVTVLAGAATDIALGLGAFAVFTQLFGWGAYHPYYYEPAVVAPPAYYGSPTVVYAAPQVMYTAPSPTYAAPAIQRVVVYPHGRYVLLGDGRTTAYEWVWIPNPAAPVPPSPAPSETR